MSSPLLGHREGGSKTTLRRVVATLAAGAAIALAAVAVVDLQGKGAQTSELGQVLRGPASLAGRRIVIAQGSKLYDAALEPLYTEGADDEVISPYEWAGANAAQYDPEAQNAWGDLPMAREDINDSGEFNGMAAKSMSKSCDKDGSCMPQENVWSYLPEFEPKSMTNRAPEMPSENAWADMTLDY
eukprot:CAMPEP_0179434752 /NCGR_PEP_ID=MMETSP0799-20121207/19006_1 /TAXON_ID=46947 /ORGANISM="Geminigera cryophila, Strain CCMP2564" /LENGTH=184 /DNA_ID=CAMNT_0021213725 /DNA_START=8 /DNA_END=562 /DNA_ORIENTATION=+